MAKKTNKPFDFKALSTKFFKKFGRKESKSHNLLLMKDDVQYVTNDIALICHKAGGSEVEAKAIPLDGVNHGACVRIPDYKRVLLRDDATPVMFEVFDAEPLAEDIHHRINGVMLGFTICEHDELHIFEYPQLAYDKFMSREETRKSVIGVNFPHRNIGYKFFLNADYLDFMFSEMMPFARGWPLIVRHCLSNRAYPIQFEWMGGAVKFVIMPMTL